MATKKTKETKTDNKTAKAKKSTTKAKTTKKTTDKEKPVVENVEVKEEEPVVVEKIVENTVEEVTVDAVITQDGAINNVKEIEKALEEGKLVDNSTPPTEPQEMLPEPSEVGEMINEQKTPDDDKPKDGCDNTYCIDTNTGANTVSSTEYEVEQLSVTEETANTPEVNEVLDEQKRFAEMEENAEINEEQVVEEMEQPKKKKSKFVNPFNRVYRWFGAKVEL